MSRTPAFVSYSDRPVTAEGGLVKVRDRLGVVVLATVAAGVLALPAAAGADVTVSSFSVAPASTAAGANVDVTINEAFTYTDTTDSVKKTVLHLPAGLLGNPQAAPKCALALARATFPRRSQSNSSNRNPFCLWSISRPTPFVSSRRAQVMFTGQYSRQRAL